MRELVHRYLSRRFSRREFVTRLAQCGFSAAAAASIVDSLAPLARAGDEVSADVPDSAVGDVVTGTGGELLVAQLHAAGVRFVFNCNSTRTYPIFDALLERPDMQVIQVPQEGQMVSLAQGYALASGQVAFTVNGSAGFPNTLNNMYNAWKDHSALVMASQREASSTQGGRDAFEEWDDYLGPAASFTRWRWNVERAERIPEITRRAFKIAATPPTGPVALAFPADVLEADGVRAAVVPRERFILKPEVKPDPALVEEAARLLLAARQPVLLVGPEVTRCEAHAEVVRLAESLSIPVAQGERLFDNFPTDHDLYVGDVFGPLRVPGPPDLVVSVGARMPLVDLGLPPDAKVVHISMDPDSIGRVMPTDLGLVADVRDASADLLTALESAATRPRLDALRAARLETIQARTRSWRRAREEAARVDWDRTPLSWSRVGGELNQLLDPDAILVPELNQAGWMGFADNAVLGQITFAPGGRRKIGRTTGAALGWGVGAALGVKLALPDRQVVALQGDGGFLFGQAETLWSMARYEVPILVLVLNNRSYNGPRSRIMRGSGRQAQAGKDLTCYLGDPDVDFVKVAAGFGVSGETVSAPDQLRPALERAIRQMREGRPYLIDALVGRTGAAADSTWHPRYSVAGSRRRPV